MILVRCDCGQALGKVSGKYEIICHKCGAKITGETAKVRGEYANVQRYLKLPRYMMSVR